MAYDSSELSKPLCQTELFSIQNLQWFGHMELIESCTLPYMQGSKERKTKAD